MNEAVKTGKHGFLRESALRHIRMILDRSPAGTRLPTVRRLMADLGMSQHVVQLALDQLRSENLITSHVGRGTFVGGTQDPRKQSRSVLTLLFQNPYERGDVIARLVHQGLCVNGQNSLVLTYSDTRQVMEMLNTEASFDTCVLQPRSSTVPISLLALLKQRSEHVLIEGLAAEHLDVDAVSNDPGFCVELAVLHLRERGYHNIIWVTEEGRNYFFARMNQIFAAYCEGLGDAQAGCRIVRAECDPERLGIRDLAGTLASLNLSGVGSGRTAVVIASFVDGRTILQALQKCGLKTPDDIGVLRIGSPDLEADHMGRLTTVGRPSTQAAATVLERISWRWSNPSLPWTTFYDRPILLPLRSTSSESPFFGKAQRRPGRVAKDASHPMAR